MASIFLSTSRLFLKRLFQAGFKEAQDVLAESAAVSMVPFQADGSLQAKEHVYWKLLYRDFTKRLIFMNPGLDVIEPARDCECLIHMCSTIYEIPYINALKSWRKRFKKTICWLDELWANRIPQYHSWLHILREFDYVFIGMKGTVRSLSDFLGKQCYYLPGGVDCLRFAPYPTSPERIVDIYSVGRRVETIHTSLVNLSSCENLFYLHDTAQNGDSEVADHVEHRRLYGNIAKRSRLFTVAPGKFDSRDETHGQVEVGFRYFEGAAAGAIMIGHAPPCEHFHELFDWNDPVIELSHDASSIRNTVRNLLANGEQCSEMSKQNTLHSLLRHDWVFRWKEIFRIAQMEPTNAMRARESQLKELADRILNEKTVTF
jgi:hypothetical protein